MTMNGPRRPVDEFFDLSTIQAIRTEDLYGDGSVLVITEVEGRGSFAEDTDTVQYKHETRFDNGQLVDLNEKRKVADNFQMDDETSFSLVRSFIVLRDAFRKMRREQVAFLKIEESRHGGIYHEKNMRLQRTKADRERMKNSVGPTVFIRVNIINIKRDPKCDTQAPLDQKLIFYNKIREINRELIGLFQEYVNAERLYARCISIFKNMPKRQKESLTEEQKLERDDILNILFANSALCELKRGRYQHCIKACNGALEYVQNNPKVYYRMALAYKGENDFDRAQEKFKKAIELAPNDKELRTGYQELKELKTQKER